jgi:hypothetical protein
MTAPTRTKPTSPEPSTTDRTPSSSPKADEAPAGLDGELQELAREQEDVAERARRVAAVELVTSPTNGRGDDERVEELLDSARAGLLAQLRDQEQERARRQLAEAARSSEDAVEGVVRGITTIVRSIVPAALVRPNDLIEATFALADQGLRVGRRVALTVTSGVRSLTLAA